MKWKTKKWLKSREFLNKRSNIKCKIENRNMIGCLNYGEIPGTLNPADGDPWDICAFGIKKRLPIDKLYIIEYFIGELVLPNGNHKLIPKLKDISIDKEQFCYDIILFKNIYEKYKKWKAGTINIKWF